MLGLLEGPPRQSLPGHTPQRPPADWTLWRIYPHRGPLLRLHRPDRAAAVGCTGTAGELQKVQYFAAARGDGLYAPGGFCQDPIDSSVRPSNGAARAAEQLPRHAVARFRGRILHRRCVAPDRLLQLVHLNACNQKRGRRGLQLADQQRRLGDRMHAAASLHISPSMTNAVFH
jgi:hypothetical protein